MVEEDRADPLHHPALGDDPLHLVGDLVGPASLGAEREAFRVEHSSLLRMR